ncbi:M12 family metallopeptidase [Melittangium boletus]|uniref:M12 family metallopeptidase n=1 Tax=Melittangium boletus TaxID=83453 RepID=UPI003DA27493
MRAHKRPAVSAMALGLALMSLVGCATQEDEGLASPAGWPEVYRPHSPREPRTRMTDRGEVRYVVVEGQAVIDGDMLMGPVAEFEARLDRGALQALGVGRNGGRWSMPVKYSFADSVTGEMRGHIQTALARLVAQSGANISFAECTGLCAGNHLKFKYQSGGGCAAHVGQLPWPAVNSVDLDDHCDGRWVSGSAYDREIGSLMHEVMHGLGVHHEQSRCDRDNFVSIRWENIPSDEHSNYDKECSGSTDHGPYDFASIMHYPSSRNNVTIIAPHNSAHAALMGSRQALSWGDINVLGGMYGYACHPSRTTCHPWECGIVEVGCGMTVACGPCQACEAGYCGDGSCCPSTGMCSDGNFCWL